MVVGSYLLSEMCDILYVVDSYKIGMDEDNYKLLTQIMTVVIVIALIIEFLTAAFVPFSLKKEQIVLRKNLMYVS